MNLPPPTTPPDPARANVAPPGPNRSRRGLLATAGIVVVGLIAGGVWYARRGTASTGGTSSTAVPSGGDTASTGGTSSPVVPSGGGTASTGGTSSPVVASGPPANGVVQIDMNAEKAQLFGLDGKPGKSYKTPRSSVQFPNAGVNTQVVFRSGNTVSVMSVADGSLRGFKVPAGLSLYPSDPLLAGRSLLFYDRVGGGPVVTVDITTAQQTDLGGRLGDAQGLFDVGQRGDALVFGRVDVSAVVSLVVPVSYPLQAFEVPGQITDVIGDRVVSFAADKVAIHNRTTLVGEKTLSARIVAAIAIDDHTALAVTADRKIVRVDVRSGAITPVGTVDFDPLRGERLGGKGRGNDRLMVWSDGQGSVLLDTAGKVVRSFSVGANNEGPASLEPAYTPPFGSRCVVLQAGPAPKPAGVQALVVDIGSGDTLAEFDSSPRMLDTPDGCTAVTPYDNKADIVLDGTLHEFSGYSSVVAVSSDLGNVVVTSVDSRPSALIEVKTGKSVDLPGNSDYSFVST